MGTTTIDAEKDYILQILQILNSLFDRLKLENYIVKDKKTTYSFKFQGIMVHVTVYGALFRVFEGFRDISQFVQIFGECLYFFTCLYLHTS